MKLAWLLTFSLVGGYAFATVWTPSLYHAARESGHRLYMRVVFYTIILLQIALFTHILLYTSSQSYIQIMDFIAYFVGSSSGDLSIFSQPSKISILILTFILGSTLGHVLNFPKWDFLINMRLPFSEIKPFFLYNKKLLQHAIKNNDFEQLITRSVYDVFPILFTLESRKVYVGWAVSAPNPAHERKSIRILPIISGYRNKDTLEVEFTTDYLPIIDGVLDDKNINYALEDLEVIIPASSLSSCHLFDMTLYNEHFKPNSPSEPTPA